jgi:hypothetical protein
MTHSITTQLDIRLYRPCYSPRVNAYAAQIGAKLSWVTWPYTHGSSSISPELAAWCSRVLCYSIPLLAVSFPTSTLASHLSL